ncbi:MAG TPA: hypothetical protein VF677_05870 [Flavobacterium sp.]|jgi:hypothetical protein
MEFKASEIDLVIEKLIETNKPYYSIDFQKLYFKDWQVLKIKTIFKYLIENHKDLLEYAENSDIYGYCIEMGEHKEIWKTELEKGGFTAFWKKKEDFKTTLKNTLTGANTSVSIINSIVSLVDKFI